MSYIVESGASTSRRARRRRALITLLVVALMLFFAFWYAYSYYRHSDTPRVAATPSCTTPVAAPRPGDVVVNVYNATDRAGLAARTAAALRKRGFKVSTVANDPLQHKVPGPAEVRYGAAGLRGSKLVLGLVKGAKAAHDGRQDASVDLVLGDKFTALAPVPKATRPAAKPAPKPTGSTTATPTGKATAKPTAKATPTATTPACQTPSAKAG